VRKKWELGAQLKGKLRVWGMKSYTFTTGLMPQTNSGTYGLNPNGSLASLAITYQFTAADNQSYTFGHDDLRQITVQHCASKFNTRCLWPLKKGPVESRVGGSEYRSEEEFLRGLED
jgi:hypothetical protein